MEGEIRRYRFSAITLALSGEAVSAIRVGDLPLAANEMSQPASVPVVDLKADPPIVKWRPIQQVFAAPTDGGSQTREATSASTATGIQISVPLGSEITFFPIGGRGSRVAPRSLCVDGDAVAAGLRGRVLSPRIPQPIAPRSRKIFFVGRHPGRSGEGVKLAVDADKNSVDLLAYAAFASFRKSGTDGDCVCFDLDPQSRSMMEWLADDLLGVKKKISFLMREDVAGKPEVTWFYSGFLADALRRHFVPEKANMRHLPQTVFNLSPQLRRRYVSTFLEVLERNWNKKKKLVARGKPMRGEFATLAAYSDVDLCFYSTRPPRASSPSPDFARDAGEVTFHSGTWKGERLVRLGNFSRLSSMTEAWIAVGLHAGTRLVVDSLAY